MCKTKLGSVQVYFQTVWPSIWLFGSFVFSAPMHPLRPFPFVPPVLLNIYKFHCIYMCDVKQITQAVHKYSLFAPLVRTYSMHLSSVPSIPMQIFQFHNNIVILSS